MKYEEFQGPVEELVLLKLREIEEKENIRVLHAVESGSRAWGFASPDSDYDVRFIYVRDRDFYLSLRDTKDFIDWELNEVLDINGWDIKKALQHFHKSNATLFEWSNSPVVYYTTEEWRKLYSQAAGNYFACKPSLYHYYGTANKNYHDYLLDSMVKYKKYFYVLRPVLACRWILERETPPPVLFSELAESQLPEYLEDTVRELLELKINAPEIQMIPRIDILNEYLEQSIVEIGELVRQYPKESPQDWAELNSLFLSAL